VFDTKYTFHFPLKQLHTYFALRHM